jgi:uncharacterized membrane protein YdfJ with MMPL/SSD domain
MAIGFGLILIYMLILYRRLGLVAVIALLVNMLIIVGSLIALRAVLTMAGIAGVVLTIGMAVDSNIIIFERIKEEKRAGKPSLAAVRAGYERSLPVIADTNAVTFVTALILLLVGSGPFIGFAITLALGIVATVFALSSPAAFSWSGWGSGDSSPSGRRKRRRNREHEFEQRVGCRSAAALHFCVQPDAEVEGGGCVFEREAFCLGEQSPQACPART